MRETEARQTEAELIKELTDSLSLVLDQRDRLQAELDKAQERLTALEAAFSEQGTLGVLQRLAYDPALEPSLRIRAASAAVQFERAKPASAETRAVFSLFNYLESRRQQPGKVITLDPERPSVDLDVPSPPTILGHDGGDAA